MTRIEYGELVHHHSDPAFCRKFAICSEQECLRRSQWNPAQAIQPNNRTCAG
jgi:hypothetical protein